MSDSPLPFVTRLWFAWACFFRVLFDGSFAARAFAARTPAALPGPEPSPRDARPSSRETSSASETSGRAELEPPKAAAKAEARPSREADEAALARAREEGSLQILALLQREGRLVDFLQQDIAPFGDGDVGATARVIHEGCRKVLGAHVELQAIRAEEEGSRVTLEAGFAASEIKLSGNVGGKAPYTGALRHRGWRATKVTLPTPIGGHDATVLCPAEVEL